VLSPWHELRDLRGRADRQADELAAARAELAAARAASDAAGAAYAGLSADRDRLADRLAAIDEAGPPVVVHDLVAVADDLVDLTDDEAIADPPAAAAFARWITQRVGTMLSHCEVTWVADEGPFDPARHEAVASRPASGTEQRGRIAETVRPGYLWRDQVVRPQQVVVYTVPEGDEPA
jgi:molecular chaperone GrpE (heat shock protein)